MDNWATYCIQYMDNKETLDSIDLVRDTVYKKQWEHLNQM